MGQWPMAAYGFRMMLPCPPQLTDETWPNVAIDYLYAASTLENLEITATML